MDRTAVTLTSSRTSTSSRAQLPAAGLKIGVRTSTRAGHRGHSRNNLGDVERDHGAGGSGPRVMLGRWRVVRGWARR